jgi:hypothetical protein
MFSVEQWWYEWPPSMATPGCSAMNSITCSTQRGQVMFGIGITVSNVCVCVGRSVCTKMPSSSTGGAGGF